MSAQRPSVAVATVEFADQSQPSLPRLKQRSDRSPALKSRARVKCRSAARERLLWHDWPVAVDVVMAILLDALLEKEMFPDGIIQGDVGRYYKYRLEH
jgi:hypothetical protein